MSFADWVDKSKQRYRDQPPAKATAVSAQEFLSGAITRLHWAAISRLSPVYTTRLAGTETHFFVDSPKELKRARTALEEKRVLEWLMHDIDDETVFWDVGAYHGTYSLVAAMKGASVVAFEPHGPNAQRLAKNAVLNDAAIDQYDVALSSEATTRSFATGEFPSSEYRITDVGEGSVETVRGDEIHPKPDVVKIDVEGHELDVLDGMVETLEGVRRIVIEVHDGVSDAAARSRLDEAGFATTTLETTRSETYLGGVR